MDRIKNLIQEHTIANQEVFGYLEELSQTNLDKVTVEEYKAIREQQMKLEIEYEMRKVFISQLEDLI